MVRYSAYYWRKPDCRFVGLRDQDSANCEAFTTILKEKWRERTHPDARMRVACRELKARYLGDMYAVERVYQLPRIAACQKTKKLHNQDGVMNPAEMVRVITEYLIQKAFGLRMIGKYPERKRNTCSSFAYSCMVCKD